jgi:hypothetical protein
MPLKKRGTGFSVEEINSLLDTIKEYLPIGMNQWEMVERVHALHYPEHKRTRESLKRKFTLLYLTKAPTGDPTIPAEVLRAKEINH